LAKGYEDETRLACDTQSDRLSAASVRTWHGSAALPRRTRSHQPKCYHSARRLSKNCPNCHTSALSGTARYV